ncbi:hypothetical protein WJX72_008649 [[Myrmecia] bisecta]|uniref:Ion transport domain-containing protein n=1 Tax=[Myrmecia] bisecta TaxID=41462 RepID=A0AAW1R7G8_9CHLO
MAPVGMPVSAPSGRQSHPGFSGRQQQDDAHTGVVKSLWRAKSGPGASDQAPEHSVRFGPANGAQAPEHSLRFAQANGACRTEDEGSPVATPRVDVSPPSEAAALAGGLSVTKSSFSYASSTFLRERSRHFMDGLKWFKQANVSLYLRLQRNDDAFFVLGPANPLRLWLQQLVDHRWFTRISMAIVLLNLVALGAYDPTCDHECRKTSNRAKAEAWADNFFTVAFSVEILLQALARCFVFGPSAYMHSAWSWIDVACVASSATIYIPGDKDNVQGMRAFRALRPLRTLSVSPGMQLLVDTLVQSLPLLVNVVVLIVWILLVFGIMGVELFQGATRGRCVDAAGNQATELAVDQVCRDIHGPPGSYSCPAPYTCSATFDAPNLGRSSFDNFGFAVLDILQTITLESWTSGQMYYFLDGAGDWSTVPYYVSLIMAGNFFALNLLTAIISAKFAQLQERQDVNQMTRDRQLSGQLEGMGWRDRLKFWLSRRVSLMRRPTMRSEMGPWRQKVRTFVNRRAFNNVVTLVIVVNTFIMALYHAGMSDRLTNVLETINMVLTVAFALEMVLKHIALGIAGYWTEWFNVTDGLIVISSVIDLIVSSLGHGRSGLSALRTFRLLRVVRSLKLLRQFPGLNKLLKMILKGFKDLKDFMVIIVLFMYIFCVLGMQLFGGSPAYSPDVTQTWRKNFNTIWSAFYVVFEILTASNWHNMMWDGMNARGDWACSYFLLWIFVGPMVLLTLFLAILINNFQEVDSDTQSATPASVSGADSRKTSLDIHHNQVVPVTDLDGHLLSMATCDVERQLKMARDANMLPTSSAFAKRVLFNSATNENDSVMKMRKWLVSIDMTYGVKNVEHVSRLMEQEEAIKARMKAVTPASQTTRLWKGLRKASDFLNHVTNGAIALEASSLPANPRSRRASIPQPASTGIQSARYPAASADNWKAPNTTIAVTAQPMALPRLSDTSAPPSSGAPKGPARVLMHRANEQHPGQSSIAHYSSLDAHMRDSSPAPNPQLGRLKRTGSSGSPGSGMQRQPSMSGGTPRRTYSLQRPDIPHLHRALFCLQPNNPIRRFAAAIVTSSLFEGMIILMILISSILLAANKPSTSPASTLARFTGVCDQIFTYVFLTELVLKVISLGLVMHPGAYLRISWNQLDCIIVVTSMVSLYNNNPALASFKTLRLMRALRPLRLISRFKGMMIVVEALLRSLPSVANVVAFGMFEFLIFSILGVQLFAGKLYFCNQAAINGVTVVHRDQCVPGTFICTAADNCPNLGQETERQWQNNFFTFDNVGEGMLSLFIVSTLDNYMDVITYHLMDAVGVDMQPVLNYNPWAGVFIVAFVFVGAFFWVNLMVGTVIDHYSNLVNEMGGNVMLTAGQKRWMDVLKLKESRKRTLDESLRPKARMRLAAWRIISHPFFEPLIMTAIMANILAMAMPYWGQSPTYGKALDWIQNAFTIFFAIEAVLKMAALGPRAYFTNRWNWLDITIVLSSSVDMIPGVNIGIGTTIIRVLRIGRMFRLVQNSRHLRTLFNTLLSSGPAILNVGSLLFLLMFVYAVLGMDLFGDPKAPLASVAHNNFNDFGVALLTLFRAFTSDAWNETLQEAGGCTTLWVKNSCNIRKSIVSAIYFISFMVMAAYIMINLVIAVILDKFVEQASAEGLFRDNGFWEVLQKQMVLERFLRRLKLKVVEYRAAHSGKKGKMRKKSIFNPQMFNPQLIAEKLAGPRMPIY